MVACTIPSIVLDLGLSNYYLLCILIIIIAIVIIVVIVLNKNAVVMQLPKVILQI